MSTRALRRVGAAALCAAALSGALAAGGCGGSSSSSGGAAGTEAASRGQAAKPLAGNEKVTISMVTYLPVLDAQAAETLHTLIQGFEAAHPNITVKTESSGTAASAQVFSTVQQDTVAGHPPDVVQTIMDGVRYLATGGLGGQPLDKLVGPAALRAELGGAHPYPRAVTRLAYVAGHQYGIPWVLSTPVLFYNADLFRRAGLNPDTPPRTWAEVRTVALAIKRATGAAGMSPCAAGASTNASDWCTQAVIKSAGGSVLGADGRTVTFTDPGAVKAVSELAALTRAGALTNVSTTQAVQEFGEGKLAMVLQSSAEQSALLDAIKGHGRLLDAPLPSFDAARPSTPTNSGSALSITSTDPVKQRAAWMLIKYLTSNHAYTEITEHIGYAPLRTSLVQDPRYLKRWADASGLTRVNLEQLHRVTPWQDYPGPNFSQIETTLLDAVQSAVFQGADPAKTLGSAQKQAASLAH